MTKTHSDSVMRMAIECPTKQLEFILQEAIYVWKESLKFPPLFINLEKYLSIERHVESEDVQDFHP